MITMEFGAKSDFLSSSVAYVTSAKLDAEHLIVGYRSGSNGYLRIGTVSGNTITGWGTAILVHSIGNEGIQISALTTTKIIIAYIYDGRTYLQVGTVSGTTITFPTAALECDSANYPCSDLSLDTVNSTYFIIAYQGKASGPELGAMKICSVSGTTITLGTVYTFNSAATDNICIKSLDSSYYIVAYRDSGGDNYGHYELGQMTGRNNHGTTGDNIFNNTNSEHISLDSTSSTVILVACGGGSDGRACGITRVGATTSMGSHQAFNANVTNYISVAGMSNGRFIITYRDEGGTNYGRARIATLSGNTIVSYSTEVSFSTVNTKHIAVCSLSSKYFGIGYYDELNVDGTAIIGNLVFTYIPRIIISGI